jgi:hypothetical protein
MAGKPAAAGTNTAVAAPALFAGLAALKKQHEKTDPDEVV